MLEAIRISQDGTTDDVPGNTVAELRKRGIFGGFSKDRMQLVLERVWNKVKHDLKDSQKWQVN